MARPTNQSTNWDFRVVPTRLHLPDGTPSSVHANLRTDTNQVIGVVSEKGYGLIQNADFITMVRGMLDALGLTGYTEDIMTTQNGARLYSTYTFNNRVKSLNKVGDQVGLRLRFANSFDGTVAAMGEVMGLVLRCLNGMMLEKGEFALQKRHNPNINLDFVKDVVANAVNGFDASLALFDRLADTSISDENGISILSHIPVSEKVREGVKDIWIRPSFIDSRARNLYSLYDAATEYLRDAETTRFEHANKTNRVILRHLVRALDSVTLGEMLKPVIEIVEVKEILEIPAVIPA